MSETRDTRGTRNGGAAAQTGGKYVPGAGQSVQRKPRRDDGGERRIGRLAPPVHERRDQSSDGPGTKRSGHTAAGTSGAGSGRRDFAGSTLQEKIKARRRSKRKRLLIIAGSIVAVIYCGVAIYFGLHFYNKTQVYGIDCSYLTAKEVKQEAAQKLDQYVLEIQEREDKTETISAQQIGLAFVDNNSIDRMLRAQRSYIWPIMLFMDRVKADSVAFSYDRARAEETLNALDCMDASHFVAPRDAYIGMTDTGYEVVPEIMGTTLDSGRTLDAVLSALDEGAVSMSLDEENCYVNPELYVDDEGLNRDAAAMSELARAHITYDFGDRTEVVDVPLIDTWIVKRGEGEFAIDEASVDQYVEELAAKYDTFGLTREFYTSIGTTVTLTGGDYGWCMNQEATAADLMAALADGYQGTMEPVYLYTAMSRDTNDIGYTYVEVCISQQRMWCYENGNLIVDTPVVTGNPNRGNATPSGGVWAIDAKMRDYVLEGEGYTAPVDYWLPFNDDVGIHDMQQRTEFGGSIYLSNGSHGCVNTPYEQAQIIYNAVSIGTPVIVYD